MRISLRRSDLLRELLLINGVVGHKSGQVALQHTLLRADDKLHISGTEIDIALTTDKCKVRVDEPGTATIHAQTLLNLVNAMPEAEIQITSDGKSTTIISERFKGKLQAIAADSYPRIPVATGEAATLTRVSLKEAVTKVFSKADDPHRHYLGGALFELQGGVMCIMSPDSRVLVPQKTVDELKMLLEEGEDDITYQQDGRHVFFTVDGRVLFSCVIEGEFPNLSRITNAVKPNSIEFDREKLLGAMTRVSLVSDASRAVTFTMERGKVTLRAMTAAGAAEEVLLVDGLVSGAMAFNTQHLIGFLNSCDTEMVSLAFGAENEPTFWRPVGLTDLDYLYVLAPMRGN